MTSEDITKDDLRLMLMAQELPMDESPYLRIAERLGTTEDKVISRLKELKKEGTIRNIGARIPHRKVGFKGNIMCVLDVPASLVDDVGTRIARSKHVSHCYHREGWIYNLFFMVHGKDMEEGIAMAKEVLDKEASDIDHDFLYSTKEFKKKSFMLKDWVSVLGITDTHMIKSDDGK